MQKFLNFISVEISKTLFTMEELLFPLFSYFSEFRVFTIILIGRLTLISVAGI